MHPYSSYFWAPAGPTKKKHMTPISRPNVGYPCLSGRWLFGCSTSRFMASTAQNTVGDQQRRAQMEISFFISQFFYYSVFLFHCFTGLVFFCFTGPMLLFLYWFSVPLSLCFSVTLILCFSVSLFHRFSVLLFHCFYFTSPLVLFFTGFLFLCVTVSVSLVHCFRMYLGK